MNFGDRVRNAREKLGMTQEELAIKAGYKDKASISKIESGKADVYRSKVAEFARILEVDISYLMGRAEYERNRRTPNTYSPTLVKLVKTAQNLNDEGQGKLSDYADDLDSSGKYRKLSDSPDTYKGKSSIIRIEPKDEQTNKKPLPFVASSSMWDEGENDEDLAEMIKKLKEDEIGRG